MNHDRISLPAGSFDLEDLEKVAASAAKAKPEERDALVAELLEKSRNRVEGEPAERIPGMLPGHRLETVEQVIQEGSEVPTGRGKQTETIGRVVMTSTIQVFDPKLGVEEATAAAEATGAEAGGAE